MLRCCFVRRPVDGLSRLSRRDTISAQLMCNCWLARCCEPIVADVGSELDWPALPPVPAVAALTNAPADGTTRCGGDTVSDGRGDVFHTASTMESMLADLGMRVLPAWSRL